MNLPPIFFDDPYGLLRVAVSAPVLYAAIILFIRLAGKRSTSQMNNFDWVVTVALGSIVGSGVMLKEVTIAETLLAIGLLLAMQWGVTKLVYHSTPVARAVKARPALLVADGAYLHEAMEHERVTEDEVNAAVRNEGLASIDKVKWVVLEADATMNVISRREAENGSAIMKDVGGMETKASDFNARSGRSKGRGKKISPAT